MSASVDCEGTPALTYENVRGGTSAALLAKNFDVLPDKSHTLLATAGCE